MKLHRLSARYSQAWLSNPTMRRELAIHIGSKLYPGEEIVVCDSTMLAIGQIAPSGIYKVVPEPRPRAMPFMAANKPMPCECPCRAFYAPGKGKPPNYEWHTSGIDEHHEWCQYNPKAWRTPIPTRSDLERIEREKNA